MSSKGPVRSVPGEGENAGTLHSTSRTSRRYAVEQAIARARSAQPWHEVSVSPDSVSKPLNQCRIEEETDMNPEEDPGEN
jgi:hypothetical protein